ncbi:MAG: endonuclease domain-containing protein, partial [Pseudomonadota bacterium]
RNFHLDGPRGKRWCGQCPKCHFVFLCLAPFMTPDQLRGVFGADLLKRVDQAEGFQALMALDEVKPFECVGEADEARAALIALSEQPAWSQHAVVSKLRPLLDGLVVPSLDALCRAGGPHRLPEDLIDAD